MWSQSSKLTVVWFYLSSRIVISLSSHYWNMVLRIGQSFPPIIASICSTNTCVPAIKFSKTLQTPHAPFWLGSCCTCVSPAFRLGGNLCCSWLLLWGWGCGGKYNACCKTPVANWTQIFALKTSNCGHVCYIIRPAHVSSPSSDFFFNPLYLF